LIFIKDYRALNSLLFSDQNNDLLYYSQLPSLIGKPITVFVDGEGVSGKGFTGILIDVLSDRIKLITSIPSAPMCKKNNNNNKCHHCCKKKSRCNFGTNTIIMIEHIIAITYNFV
jgi:hypothetical protein